MSSIWKKYFLKENTFWSSVHNFLVYPVCKVQIWLTFIGHLSHVTFSKTGVIIHILQEKKLAIFKYKNQDLNLVLPKLSSSEFTLNIPVQSAPRSINKILLAPQHFPSVPLQVYPPEITFISSFSTHMYQF